MAGAVRSPSVNVVSTSLLHTGSRCVVRVFVNGTLQLLQELINVEKVTLGA